MWQFDNLSDPNQTLQKKKFVPLHYIVEKNLGKPQRCDITNRCVIRCNNDTFTWSSVIELFICVAVQRFTNDNVNEDDV